MGWGLVLSLFQVASGVGSLQSTILLISGRYGVWVRLVCGVGTVLLRSHQGLAGFFSFSAGLLCTGLFTQVAP